jgi:hypothetical protein
MIPNGKYILHPKNFRSECWLHRQGSDGFFFPSVIYLWWDLTWLLYSSILFYIYCNHTHIYIHTVITYIYIYMYVYIYIINIHLYVVLCSSWLRSSFNHLREHVDLKLINLIKKWSTWNHLDYPKKVEPSPCKQAEAGNFHAQSEATDMDEIWDETWMPPWCCRKRDGQWDVLTKN